MRMWGVDPSQMCRSHLLGEHLEMHMFLGTILKGISIKGYILKGVVNPALIKVRHDELVDEMIRRGYKHQSPAESPRKVMRCIPIDIEESERELKRRCSKCFNKV